MSHLRLSVLGLLLAALLAACTSTAATPTSEPTPEPTPTATPESTPEPTATAQAGGSGENELAAVLPDEVGGLTLTYEYQTGAAVIGSEGITPEVQAFFERTGADPSDLSSAFGSGFDAEAGAFIVIVAFRVAGANEAQLIEEFRTVAEEQTGTALSETSVGGKSVLVMAETDSTTYLYGRGDVIFSVGASTPELAEEALAQLP